MYDDTDPSIPLVRLIGGLSLHYGGRRMALPSGTHRLLAHLALHRAGVDRRSAAEVLWPTADDGRAAGSLSAALWRLQQVGCPLVRADQSTLALREGVEIDLARLEGWAGRISSGTAGPDDLAVDPAAIAELELLPGWHDDWILPARERLHLRRSHALEQLSLLRQPNRSAVTPGVPIAVRAELPLGSSQLGLIDARQDAHQEGCGGAVARRPFDGVRRLLRRELAGRPSPRLTALAP